MVIETRKTDDKTKNKTGENKTKAKETTREVEENEVPFLLLRSRHFFVSFVSLIYSVSSVSFVSSIPFPLFFFFFELFHFVGVFFELCWILLLKIVQCAAQWRSFLSDAG